MQQTNRYVSDFLGLSDADGNVLWRVGTPTGARAENGDILLDVPFYAQQPGTTRRDPDVPTSNVPVRVRAYGDAVVRLSLAPGGDFPGDESVMLEWSDDLRPEPLALRATDAGWEMRDQEDRTRFAVRTAAPPLAAPPLKRWSTLIPDPPDSFEATAFPDGRTTVPFLAYDSFSPGNDDSLPLAFVTRGDETPYVAFSLHAAPDERFAGTGERFAPLNLAGQTILLKNADAAGVNSRRAYKNVPFYLSSKGYGLLVLTSAHTLLSLAGQSTRAAQGVIEDGILDLFFVGGGAPERILFHLRRLTGFPRDVPLWSYGIWMGRMTYFRADETREVARQLREGGFPCDVIHVDTGWFARDWQCEWEFSAERFPDPEAYLREMRAEGFRISLWQMPTIGKENKHFDEARRNRYIAPRATPTGRGDTSNFSELEFSGTLDFSHPEAVRWYQSKLEPLLRLGASVIKTDFGEQISMTAVYHALPARLLHNLYALLYQKAAFEITERATGEGIIWARAAWAGCQRYPVHWGGDAACTWDGMAGTLRGGLHLGCSGFAFWSHDVPGFHGVPNFMNSWPPDDLYVRWTQFGVFTSHIRYHGAQPREPYEYPAVADLVRRWWRLRYCLIPYLAQQGAQSVASGLPLLRALIFHDGDDPTCWQVDDQFLCGDAFLVAPIMNGEGRRDVYLPAGSWTDFWTGEILHGPRRLRGVTVPLSRMPLYARTGSRVPVYPELVDSTNDMDPTRIVELVFDEAYAGLQQSALGTVVEL